jgi:Fe-S oxidoreductase
VSFPAFAHWVARARLSEAAATGAEAVVSAAPLCSCTLRDAIGAGSVTVADITQIIVDAL